MEKQTKEPEIKRSVGRPKFVDENISMSLRVPKKCIIVAEGLDIPYKKYLRLAFEKMVCAAILVKRGNNDCEICENVVTRSQLIEEEFIKTLNSFSAAQEKKNQEDAKFIVAITQAVTAGMSRGEAEQGFGRVFPDELWDKYGGKA